MSAAPRLAFIEPMKATIAPPPPCDGKWLYEVKFDGFRALAIKQGRKVELWSRNRKPLNGRFPEIVEAVAKLPAARCILDGEVCALDARGRSSFQLLQNAGEGGHPLVYYVFDLLAEGRRDLRHLSLLERKERLDAALLKVADPVRPSLCFTENPAKVLEKMKAAGAEGAIAKRIDSAYEAGRRSGAWIKIKFHRGQEFVIAGYTLPKSSRKYFGALLLGYYRGSRLVFAGRVGTGFNDKALREIHRKLKPLECDEPQIEEVQEPSSRWRPKGWKVSDTRWVQPRLVAQVRFSEWTQDGILRHPSFQGLRDDKNPKAVVRES